MSELQRPNFTSENTGILKEEVNSQTTLQVGAFTKH